MRAGLSPFALLFPLSFLLIREVLSEDCKNLGFVGSPFCTDCDRLLEFTKDRGIFEECKECCEVGNTETGSKVERVILEVCKHRLREFPQIDGFIKQQLSLYSNVQISYRWGFSPRLVLKFSDKQKETIRIDSWTTDNIVEYLDDRIVKSKVVIGTS